MAVQYRSFLLAVLCVYVDARGDCGLEAQYNIFKASMDTFLASGDRECTNVTITDCQDLLSEYPDAKDGVYKVKPRDGKTSFPVYCDMSEDGGGWLVIQKRLNGSEDFYRDWFEYMEGFGNLSGEFWLGNEKIHRLTSQRAYQLRIDLEDADGIKMYALYDVFRLGDMSSFYTLHVGTYSGNAGDKMGAHNNFRFTAKNLDLDESKTNYNCAIAMRGAWWYNRCASTSLNGAYVGNKYHLYWGHIRETKIKFSTMKIRPLS